MPQKYKVYFAHRPVIFAHHKIAETLVDKGAELVISKGKMDTMLIENALHRGARSVIMACDDVAAAWTYFSTQFEFVQAAGGVVLNPHNQMLFIYRLDKWDLPKGKVEDDESVQEGALREVEEECGIANLHLEQHLCTTWHTYLQNGHPMLKATTWYIMRHDGNATLTPQAIEGITDVKWLGLNETDDVRKNTYPSVIEVLKHTSDFLDGQRISEIDIDGGF
jgi:ADP-ribose pyrophosphatase YjhB (NUDIX family)